MREKPDPQLTTLTKANEANMYALTPFCHDWPSARKYVGPDLSWCVTDTAFPWCNVAFGARLDEKDAEGAIRAFTEEGMRRNVPLCWWINGEARPADLAARLRAHGFVKRGDTSLMAVDLYEMNEKGRNIDGLDVKQVEDTDELRLWCSVTGAGFNIPASGERALFEWLSATVGLGMPVRFYLASVRGLPVATSMLFLAEGVAGLYFIATVPAARRQGVGTEITLTPLQEARAMGYGIGVLQASKMGEGIYRRIGFFTSSTIVSYIRMHEQP